jgi:hypothetical protein
MAVDEPDVLIYVASGSIIIAATGALYHEGKVINRVLDLDTKSMPFKVITVIATLIDLTVPVLVLNHESTLKSPL